MKPRPFDYARPDTVDEAVALLAEHGDEARILAGGQSLMAMMNLRLADPAMLIDIARIAELGHIRDLGDTIEVGAAVTQNKLLAWPDLKTKLPLLAAALPFVGHFQTRNKGTVCGSIAHADPSSEIPLSLATLEGEVVLRGKRGERVLKAKDFQLDMMTTAREGDELIVAVRFPVHGKGVAFREVARRHGDFAMVAVAALHREQGQRPARRRRHGGQRRWCGASRTAASRTRSRSSPRELEGYEDLHASAELRRDILRNLAPARHRGGATMRRVNKDQKVRISLTLNGRKLSAETEPRTLLSDFLRHSLGATGTHVGCEHGVCGCCTVQIDGAAVRSCLTLAMQAEGRDVKTVELLAGDNGKLNKLQQAFQNHHALQCGFCTPGILMSFTDFLARNPKPTEEELRDVLSGHICRCTGYAGIMAALKEAVGISLNKGEVNERTDQEGRGAQGQAGLPRACHHQRQERRARAQRAAGGQRRRAGDGRDFPDVQHLRREVLAVEHRQGRRHAAAALHLQRLQGRRLEAPEARHGLLASQHRRPRDHLLRQGRAEVGDRDGRQDHASRATCCSSRRASATAPCCARIPPTTTC